MVLRNFKIGLHLRGPHVFIRQSLEILNVFITLTLKYVFWKTKSLFEKLQYHVLFESTAMKSAILPYKTGLPKVNIKTNRMWSTNRPITKSGLLQLTTLFFWKFNFGIRTSYK